jgi:hypothetical protein
MRRKLRNLKNKSGDSQNGSPRSLIDETVYREHRNHVNAIASASGNPQWDPQYSGWSNASRSRDHAIFLRGPIGPSGITGPTGPTGPTQFVDLGTAADFAIFSFAGITTTGGSTVNGDMGVDPVAIGPDPGTSITGFILSTDGGGTFSISSQVFAGPGGQLGRVYGPDYAPPTPAKVVLAHNDVLAAFTDAATRTPDVTHAGGDLFADSPFLAGLVYQYTGASTIGAGDITINGNVTDGIIIQVEGTLDIFHNVTLIGGILPQNVYFAVDGELTCYAPGFTINGELLCASGIHLQKGTILNGRALAQTNVTLDGAPANNVVINEM